MTGVDIDGGLHDVRVEYGNQLERAAELLHNAARAFAIRADIAVPPTWLLLTETECNQVRAGLDQLARNDLEVLEDLAYLARRIRERDF